MKELSRLFLRLQAPASSFSYLPLSRKVNQDEEICSFSLSLSLSQEGVWGSRCNYDCSYFSLSVPVSVSPHLSLPLHLTLSLWIVKLPSLECIFGQRAIYL